jgi:hypothetical protein
MGGYGGVPGFGWGYSWMYPIMEPGTILSISEFDDLVKKEREAREAKMEEDEKKNEKSKNKTESEEYI